MSGVFENVDDVAHVIQVALTPVFLLAGVATLLSVFSTRLGRVADRVDRTAEQLEAAAGKGRRLQLRQRLANLKRRTLILDFAVILGSLSGGATCLSALLLFVGLVRDRAEAVAAFAAFGLALVLTAAALVCFVFEMLLASRDIRIEVREADESHAKSVT